MSSANPVLIQNPPRGTPGHRATPLVLIHDGGGTIFSYYVLPDLSRRLYGLADPHFGTERTWPGGIADMGRHYAGLIKAAIPRGRVILGGWSLGGLTALNAARDLADDPWLRVVGVVMIDTVCPLTPPGGWEGVQWPAPVVDRKIDWDANTRAETKKAVETSFRESAKMAWGWVAPTWEEEVNGAGGEEEEEEEEEEQEDDEPEEPKAVLAPPPAILLRAREKVPVEGGMVLIDVWRGDRLLGWDHYRKKFFSRVLDIPGNHYAAFAEDNIFELSEQLKSACQTIEELAGVS